MIPSRQTPTRARPGAKSPQKIVGVLMAYNCAPLLEGAFRSIPPDQLDELICVDDGSTDNTFAIASQLGIQAFTHPHLGYGGNLFFGFQRALEMGATAVIELHGDGQYDFSAVFPAVQLLTRGSDMVLGNRFYDLRQPFRDGMELPRYIGNLIITAIGRVGLGIPTRDLFPGFRAYSRQFIETIDLERMSKSYFFSFEIIALARFAGLDIRHVPVRCNYRGGIGLRASPVFFLRSVFHTTYTVLLYRLARLNVRRGVFAT